MVPTQYDKVLSLQSKFKLDEHKLSFSKLLYKIDLSGNYLESLPTQLGQIKSLRIIFLHFNLLKSESFINLFCLGSLNYLTIFNNPIASKNGIRATLVGKIPTLLALDFNAITDEERNENIFLNENSKYRMLSNYTKIEWPILLESEVKNLSDNQIFWLELNIIRRSSVRSSFILTIQKCFRGLKQRRQNKYKVKVAQDMSEQIIKIVKHWMLYTVNRRETHSILINQCRPQFIKILNLFRDYKKRKLINYMNKNASKIIFKAIRNNYLNHQNFFQSIEKKGGLKFYFSKYQLQLFLKLLDDTLRFILQYQKNRRLIESIVQFIQGNGFCDNPQKNMTRHLRLSDIKSIRIANQDQKFNQKNMLPLLYSPAKLLKVGFNIKKSQALNRLEEQKLKQTQNQFYDTRAPNYTNFKSQSKEKSKQIEFNKTISDLEADQQDKQEAENLKLELYDSENENFLIEFHRQIKVKELKQDRFRGLTLNQNQKFLRTKKKIDQFQEDEYKQLMETQFPNRTLHKEFLRVVFIHNRRAQKDKLLEQFHLYFDYQVFEINSILKIQKAFRGFLNTKRNGISLKLIMMKINQKRAVMLIQRWLRRLKENHRNHFFKEISFRASLITSRNLFLSEEIYTKILDICQTNKFHIKFLEQLHEIVVDPIQRIVRLSQKQITFQTAESKDSLRGQIFQQKTNQILQESIKRTNILPQWLIKQICNVPSQKNQKIFDLHQLEDLNQSSDDRTSLNDLSKHFQKKQDMKQENLKFLTYQHSDKGDILHIIHTGSSCTWVIVDDKKYLCLKFESVVEARYRMISLALHTYRFKMNGCFLWMFGDELWENYKLNQNRTRQILNEYFIKIKKVYDINFLRNASPKVQNLKQTQVPHIFLFTAHSKKYINTQNQPEQILLSLFAQNLEKKTLQKITGYIMYLISPKLFLFDNDEIQIKNVIKNTSHQEVQSCEEEKWFKCSTSSIMDLAFNNPLSSDNTTYVNSFSQRFSVLQLDKKIQLPTLKKESVTSNQGILTKRTSDVTSLQNYSSENAIMNYKTSILERSQLYDRQKNNKSIYGSNQEQVIFNKRNKSSDSNQYNSSVANSLLSQTQLPQSCLDSSMQDILIQDYQVLFQKPLQQRIEKQLLREIRYNEKLIHLEQIKDRNSLAKSQISYQIEQNQINQIERNRQKILEVQSSRKVKKANEEEEVFLKQFISTSNCVIKQDTMLEIRKASVLEFNNISFNVVDRRKQNKIKRISKFQIIFNNSSTNHSDMGNSSVQIQQQRNLIKPIERTFSPQANKSIPKIQLVQNEHVSQRFPQIQGETKIYKYLHKSDRKEMFNKFQSSYLHKYRHSVFPEEFFPIGGKQVFGGQSQ